MFRERNLIYKDKEFKGVSRIPKKSKELRDVMREVNNVKHSLEYQYRLLEKARTAYLVKQCELNSYELIAKKELEEIYKIETKIEQLENDLKFWLEIEKQERAKQQPCHKRLKRSVKKMSDSWVKEEILKIIEEVKKENRQVLHKEDVAFKLQVKISQVEKIFMQLNREGLLSQAKHHILHDSNREPYGFGGDSAWASDCYYIR